MGHQYILWGKKGVAVALPTHGYQNCTYPKFVIKIEGIFFFSKDFFLYIVWNMEYGIRVFICKII
jgi:hypothetical protein